MFGENLKTPRKNKGITQEKLAARLNIGRQTISKWKKVSLYRMRKSKAKITTMA